MVATNTAERDLARALVVEICELCGSSVDAAQVERIVDCVAPLGEKRRFCVLSGEVRETVEAEGLPRYRTIQTFDESALDDAFGDHLRKGNLVDAGKIPDDRREEICRQAVAFHFEELKRAVAELATSGLAENLVARHEALIARRRLLDITIATHLACFGHGDAEVATLQREIGNVDRASLASRFLIEYVTTCPPDGANDLSLSTYDRLIALAAEMARFGRFSSLQTFGARL